MKFNCAQSYHTHWKKHLWDDAFRETLWDRKSMTRRLRRVCKNFNVKVVSNGYAKPLFEEANRLGIPQGQYVWCREVLLCDGDTPFIYGRSLLPPQALYGHWQGICHMQNVPLGKWLFRVASVERSPFEIALINTRHKLYKPIQHLCPTLHDTWARRSEFSDSGLQCLLTEVFLKQF